MEAAQTQVINNQPGDSSSKQATIGRRQATYAYDFSNSLNHCTGKVSASTETTPLPLSKKDLSQQNEHHLKAEQNCIERKKIYNKAYPAPNVNGVKEMYCSAEIPILSSNMENFEKATIYPSFRGKLDYYSKDMGPRGLTYRSISEGHTLKHVQQSGSICTTIIEKSENRVITPSISGFVIENNQPRNLFTKSHPDHNKIFQAYTWVADPANNKGIIFTANSCLTPKSPTSPDSEEASEQVLTLVGSNIHNSSFSRLLQSKIKPNDVKGRVLFDVLTQGDKALVAFLVKDNMISFSVVNFSDQYFKEMKENTVILNTTQEKPDQKELEGMIVKDFNFGVQSLDGIVRICVLLVHPQLQNCVCRIFEIGTNLREFNRLHTIKLAEPFSSSKFSRVILNWDYDQLVAFGVSNCDTDARYKYLNTALKSLGRFSKNKCIKLTQTPALISCLGAEYSANTDPEAIPHRIELSVKDFQKPAEFLFPKPEPLSEVEVVTPEVQTCLGKRIPYDHSEPAAIEVNQSEGPQPAQPPMIETYEDKKPQQTKKAKIKGPNAHSVTMQESLSRGNWAIAFTLSNSDFFGQITLGNLGISTHWRNFRDPRADVDTALDEYGFKTLQYVTKTDPETKRTVVDDGKVAIVQGLRNILGLKFTQVDQHSTELTDQVDKDCLKTVNFEKFEDFLSEDKVFL